MTLDDKNTVRCKCGSQTFERRCEEHEAWELLPIKQDDGRVLHKSVCVTNVTVHIYCEQCGEEVIERPGPVLVSERPLAQIEEKRTNGSSTTS